ncbi:MAG: FtsH protease activity modulator HflK [Pseudomonadota bacterium]
MPWNQPGSNGDDRDPWGQNRGGRQDSPPNLDDVFRDVKNRVDSMFGGKSGGRRSGGGDGDDRPPVNAPGGGVIALGILIALGFWLFTGLYTVEEGEQAVELRFGALSETNDAGLHYHFPAPFETVEIVNIKKENTVEVGYRSSGRAQQSVSREALMLTQDENIIDIKFAVTYDIKDPTQLLFNVSEYNSRDIAEDVVRQATESAVREIVGRNSMDFAISEGRAQLAAETKDLVQTILDRYQTGINIRTVEMQDAQPPAQVKDAFDDVVKAREDEQRLKNLAEAYANDIVPRARGFAARIIEEAEAYKASVIAKAEGEASRFSQVLDEYEKAPEVTRDRLYLESMEEVLSRSSKLVIDQQGGNSLMYLPIDQLMQGRSQGGSRGAAGGGFQSPTEAAINRSENNSLRNSSRDVNRSSRN